MASLCVESSATTAGEEVIVVQAFQARPLLSDDADLNDITVIASSAL